MNANLFYMKSRYHRKTVDRCYWHLIYSTYLSRRLREKKCLDKKNRECASI